MKKLRIPVLFGIKRQQKIRHEFHSLVEDILEAPLSFFIALQTLETHPLKQRNDHPVINTASIWMGHDS